jgi:hypothetical protein
LQGEDIGVPMWVRQAARLVFRQATGPRLTEDLTSIAGCIECDAGFASDNTGDVFRQPAVVRRTVIVTGSGSANGRAT